MEYAKISNQYNYFCGGDMHSKSSYFVVLDRTGKRVRKANLANQANLFKDFIAPFAGQVIVGVESNFNYPWLFDLCQAQNIPFILGHAAYMRAIAGNKTKNDRLDASTIANLMRTNFFPLAFPYPKEDRHVRDLLRRRHFFVRQRTGLITHCKLTLYQENIIEYGSSAVFKNQLKSKTLIESIDSPMVKLNLETNIKMIVSLNMTIAFLEKSIKEAVKKDKAKQYVLLQTIPGVGELIALIIIYETYDIKRFKSHQKYASYCRVVMPQRMSNGIKKKGGNPKMGNPYLKWAFGQILHNARMCNEAIDAFYRRLERKHGTKKARAIMAHKFNTAVYYMLKNETEFDLNKFLNRK